MWVARGDRKLTFRPAVRTRTGRPSNVTEVNLRITELTHGRVTQHGRYFLKNLRFERDSPTCTVLSSQNDMLF